MSNIDIPSNPTCSYSKGFLTRMETSDQLFHVRLLCSIFLTAFVLRLVYLILVGLSTVPESDAYYYAVIAQNLVKGCGFISFNSRTYRPPGQPWFLAMVYYVFGVRHDLARIVLAFLGALHCIVQVAWARVISSRRVAYFTGLLSALYVQLIRYPQTLNSEVLYIFLIALGIWALFQALQRRSIGWHALAGVLFGLAALTREVAILMPLAVGFWYLIARKSLPSKLGRAWLVFFISLGLTVLPWTIRNWLVLDAFIPVTTNGGINFYFGNHKGATGEFEWILAPGVEWRAGASELAAHRQGLAEGLRFCREHPVEMVSLWFKKLWILWRPPFYGFRGLKFRDAAIRATWLLFYTALLGLGICGFLVVRCFWRITFLPLLMIVYPTLIHMLTVASTRYRLPMVAVLTYFAAIGLEQLLRQVTGIKGPPLVSKDAFSPR